MMHCRTDTVILIVSFTEKMFPTSTQLKFWTFSGTAELNRLRIEANQQFVEKYGSEYNVRIILFNYVYNKFDWHDLVDIILLQRYRCSQNRNAISFQTEAQCA